MPPTWIIPYPVVLCRFGKERPQCFAHGAIPAKFLDACHHLPVVLEPWFRLVVPLNSRHEKSENRRSITGGVELEEF